MEDLVHLLDRIRKRTLLATVSVDAFDGKFRQPLQIARFPDETSDFGSPLKKSFDQMASDETGGSRY
jgi:hypothetical protein